MIKSLLLMSMLLLNSFKPNPNPDPDPNAKLLWVEFYSETGSDNKDHDTGIWVYVFQSNGKTLIDQIENVEQSPRDATEYNDYSYHYVKMPAPTAGLTYQNCQGFKVTLQSQANGNDDWRINKAEVLLYFSDGTVLTNQKSDFDLNSRQSTPVAVNF